MRSTGAISWKASDSAIGRYGKIARTILGQLENRNLINARRGGGIRVSKIKRQLKDGTEITCYSLPSPSANSPVRIIRIRTQEEVQSGFASTRGFIFYPVADEAVEGWGIPFTDVNVPLGTVGGGYRESVLKPNADDSVTHLRKYSSYGGTTSHNLRMGEGYHKYDWRSSGGEVLSIWCYDGNRYFGIGHMMSNIIYLSTGETATDPTPHIKEWRNVIFYNGRRHSFTYGGLPILGMGLATHQGVKYLYAVCASRPYGGELKDESYIVYRRRWQPTPYANSEAYDSSSNPFGWEEVTTINQPSYTVYEPRVLAISENLTGALGGAHFSSDGTKFLMMFRAFDEDRGSRGGDLFWTAGYYEVEFSGDGTTVNSTWNANPLGLGPTTVQAVDYNKNNEIVKFYYWNETLGASEISKYSIRMETATNTSELCIGYHNEVSTDSYEYIHHYLIGLDLRTETFATVYRHMKWDADPYTVLGEEFGTAIVENGGPISYNIIKTAGTSFNNPGVTGTTSDFITTLDITHPWYGNAYTRYFNYLKSDYEENHLISIPVIWDEIVAKGTFHGIPDYPADQIWNYHSGHTQASLETALSLDTYTDPELKNLGVVNLFQSSVPGLGTSTGYVDDLTLPVLDYPGTQGYSDAVLLDDGTIFSVPLAAAYARRLNPVTGAASISTAPVSEFYQQGILLSSGDVYMIPTLTSTAAGIYDTSADTISNATGSFPANCELISGVLMGNGKILLLVNEDLNSGATTLKLYDTSLDTLTNSSVTFTSPDRFSWPVLLDDGTVYLVRYENDGGFAKIYDPTTDTVINADGPNASSAADYIRFGLKLPDGTVYMPPGIITGDARAQIYDPVTDTTTDLGIDHTSYNFKWSVYKAVNGPGADYVTNLPHTGGTPYFEVQRISTGVKYYKDDYIDGGNTYFLSNDILDYHGGVTLAGGENVFLGGGATEPLIHDVSGMRYMFRGFTGGGCCPDATLLADGRVFCSPGITGEFTDYDGFKTGQPARARIYDPSLNTVTTPKGEYNANSYGKTVLLPDGRVFIIPSWAPDIYIDTDYSAKVYDPDTGVISTPFTGIGATFSARVAIPLSDGKVLILDESIDAIWTYDVTDFSTKTFSTVSIIAGDYTDAVELEDGRILLIPDGGTAKIFDRGADTLTTTGASISGWYTAGVLLDDGRVYMVPGTAGESAIIYDPVTDSKVTATGTFATSHMYSDAVKLLDGRVFLVPYDSTTAAIYNPYNDVLSDGLGNYASNYTGEKAYSKGVLMNNGSVFCVPYNATTVRIFGTAYNRVPVDGTTNSSADVIGASSLTADLSYHATLLAGDVVGTSSITANLSASSYTAIAQAIIGAGPIGFWQCTEASGNFANLIEPTQPGVPTGSVTYQYSRLHSDWGDTSKGALLQNGAKISVSGFPQLTNAGTILFWYKASPRSVDSWMPRREKSSSTALAYWVKVPPPRSGPWYDTKWAAGTYAGGSGFYYGLSANINIFAGWAWDSSGVTTKLNQYNYSWTNNVGTNSDQGTKPLILAEAGSGEDLIVQYIAIFDRKLTAAEMEAIRTAS